MSNKVNNEQLLAALDKCSLLMLDGLGVLPNRSKFGKAKMFLQVALWDLENQPIRRFILRLLFPGLEQAIREFMEIATAESTELGVMKLRENVMDAISQ